MATIYGTNASDNNSFQGLWPYLVYYPELIGTDYADNIYGFNGNDILRGKWGDDYLNGGAGSDTMYGGSGNDKYVVDSSSDIVKEYVYTYSTGWEIKIVQEGIDTIESWINSYTLPANVENLSLMGNYALTGRGNSLNNSLSGTNNDNFLFGYDGHDSLSGLNGIDVLFAGNGNDTLWGGNDSDYLYGEAGGDGLFGESGDDVMLAGEGNDHLVGGHGNDYLDGEAGNDRLIGGAGNDVLKGGIGSDRFDFETYKPAAGIDTIYNFNAVEDSIGLDVGSSLGVFEKGLVFTNGQLNTAWYFEGNGFNGNGSQLSGIYVDTSNGYVWYNPTSNTAGDNYQFATIDTATIVGGITSLSAADFVAAYYNVLH